MQKLFVWDTQSQQTTLVRFSSPEIDRLRYEYLGRRQLDEVDPKYDAELLSRYSAACDAVAEPLLRCQRLDNPQLGKEVRLLLRSDWTQPPVFTEMLRFHEPPTIFGFRRRVVEVLQQLGLVDTVVQLVSVPLYDEASGRFLEQVFLPNWLVRAGCIDWERSEFLEDIIWVYRSLVPPTPVFWAFDIEEPPIFRRLIVSQEVRSALIRAQIRGCQFVPVRFLE